jgi:hypothetical protein
VASANYLRGKMMFELFKGTYIEVYANDTMFCVIDRDPRSPENETVKWLKRSEDRPI